MTKYYEVVVSQTTKPINKITSYYLVNQEVKQLPNIAEAKNYLKAKYQGHKRVKIYRDGKDGEAIHTGYIYSFKNSDYDNGKKYFYWQQDWVSINEIQSKPVIITV